MNHVVVALQFWSLHIMLAVFCCTCHAGYFIQKLCHLNIHMYQAATHVLSGLTSAGRVAVHCLNGWLFGPQPLQPACQSVLRKDTEPQSTVVYKCTCVFTKLLLCSWPNHLERLTESYAVFLLLLQSVVWHGTILISRVTFSYLCTSVTVWLFIS